MRTEAGEVGVVGRDEAALARDDDLRRAQAEHLGGAEPADPPVAARRAERVSGVEHDGDPGVAGHRLERFGRARRAEHVGGEHRAGAGDPGATAVGVDLERGRVALDEERVESVPRDRVAGGREREARQNDRALRAATRAARASARRCTTRPPRRARPRGGGGLALELAHERAVREHAAFVRRREPGGDALERRDRRSHEGQSVGKRTGAPEHGEPVRCHRVEGTRGIGGNLGDVAELVPLHRNGEQGASGPGKGRAHLCRERANGTAVLLLSA